MDDFHRYVNEHLVKRITVGQSGAYVYQLDNSRIAKYICRGELNNEELWDSYRMEYLFYSHVSSSMYRFIPKIYHCGQTDGEIQIIMEQYRPLDRNCLDDGIIEGAMAVLAQIHSLPIPDFITMDDPKPLKLSGDGLSECVRGWRSVIDEHGRLLSESELCRVAESINDINDKLFSPARGLCHGDFHFDNLLLDDHGEIVVCDWQGVGVGHPSEDISYFISRLSADGVRMDRKKVIGLYCRHSGASMTEEEIDMQMRLANMNRSFVFCHLYLHGSSADRVKDIFGRMVSDLDALLAASGRNAG